VAALGPESETAMGEGVSSFGPGSTFDALLELDAWVVFLGVSLQCCTALHAVEEFVGVPYRKHRNFEGSVVILPDGTRMPSKSIEYLRQDGSANDFAKMEAIYDEADALRRTWIGASDCKAIRIRELFRITRPLLEQDFGLLSRSRSA
jgi:aminoglycoside N3'-acetyltransferase